MKKRIVALLKVFSLVSILLLSVNSFAIGMSADTCDDPQCQQCCTPNLHQHKAAMEAHSPSSPCCSGTQGCSCHLSKGRTPDLPETSLAFVRLEHRSPVKSVIIETNDCADNHLPKGDRRPLHAELMARSAPIYIQHLSLLC